MAHFERGDEVEIATKLIDDLTSKTQPTVVSEGALYRYAPKLGIWERLDRLTLEGKIQSYAGDKLGNNPDAPRKLKISNNKCKGAANLILNRPNLQSPAWFKSTALGVVFANGFVALVDGEPELQEHSPDHRIRHALPFDYDPKAKDTNWRNFLASTFKGDGDIGQKRNFLQEFVGVSLLGRATDLESCALFLGSGSNGKSILIKTITRLFPKSAVCSVSPKHFDKLPSLAALAGKLLNTVSELPKAALLESSEFKAAVTGDQISGRHLYQNQFDFNPQAGFLFAANSLPDAKQDLSEGFWRRFVMISFNRHFTPDDKDFVASPKLQRYLNDELPAIAAWALRGAARALEAEQYTVPLSSDNAVATWQMDSDPILAWYKDSCIGVVGGKTTTSCADLYDDFVDWCEDMSVEPSNQIYFGRRLTGMSLKKVSKSTGTHYAVRLKG